MEHRGFTLFVVRGIPIRAHWTLLVVLPLLAFGFARAFREAALVAEISPAAIRGSPLLWGGGVAVALFLSVLLHELAHSLYAVSRGGKVQDITLLLIGGISRILEPPKKIGQEAVMALVGPLLSLALGVAFFALHVAVSTTWFNLRFALFYLGSLNIFLGLFNLLPAFPMDGGRVLRSLLAQRMGMMRATRVAASVGKAFAVLFGIVGFLSFNMLLLVIAFFVFVGAEAEARTVGIRELKGRLRVQDVMRREVLVLSSELTVKEAADRMIAERRLVSATFDGRKTGLVTLDAITRVPESKRGDTPVAAIALPEPVLSPQDDAAHALELMAEVDTAELPVVEGGSVIAVVGRDDIVRGLRLAELEQSFGLKSQAWRPAEAT